MIDLSPFLLPAAALTAMILLSVIAALRFPANARVPMQWGPGGKPTWTAPVWLAVSFTPVLAIIAFAVTLAIGGRAGSPMIGTLLSVQGVLFLVIHAAHLYFARPRRA
jgi:hypothetical protein